MAGRLTFKVDETLKRIVEHSRKHGKCRIPYSEETRDEPGLFLVKDEGVYLMSASTERLWKVAGDEDGGCVVAYAEHCDPEKNPDSWDEARSICGGDDFAELLDLGTFEEAIRTGASRVVIDVSEDTLGISYSRGRRS